MLLARQRWRCCRRVAVAWALRLAPWSGSVPSLWRRSHPAASHLLQAGACDETRLVAADLEMPPAVFPARAVLRAFLPLTAADAPETCRMVRAEHEAMSSTPAQETMKAYIGS